MVKHLARHLMLAVLGLTGVIYLEHVAAQDPTVMDANIGSLPGGGHHDMMQNSPFVSSGILPNQGPYSPNLVPNGRHPGSRPDAPLMLLPLPINGMSGFNSLYGFQYPGSYLPSGTPLHRFNGYITCDPPAVAPGQRIVKITSTRSLSAPDQTQPCPVYTINGEIGQPKSYRTTTTSPSRNPAGERQ